MWMKYLKIHLKIEEYHYFVWGGKFLYGGTIILYGGLSRPALGHMENSFEKTTEDSLEF